MQPLAASLCQQFMDIARDYRPGVTQGVLGNIVTTVAIGGLGVWIGHKYTARKTKKAILTGEFANNHAVVGYTDYSTATQMDFKTGKNIPHINPATDKPFTDQRIRNIATLKVADIFPDHPMMADYLGKAATFCSHKEPIVFQHLDKVIKPCEREKIKMTIAQGWVNFFSEQLNDNLHAALSNAAVPEQTPVEKTIYPILTREPLAEVRKLRIFFMTPAQLVAADLPQAENLRVEEGEAFTRNPKHRHMHRLETYQTIAGLLDKAEWQWIKNMFGVKIPTGEFKQVPVPAGALAPT